MFLVFSCLAASRVTGVGPPTVTLSSINQPCSVLGFSRCSLCSVFRSVVWTVPFGCCFCLVLAPAAVCASGFCSASLLLFLLADFFWLVALRFVCLVPALWHMPHLVCSTLCPGVRLFGHVNVLAAVPCPFRFSSGLWACSL